MPYRVLTKQFQKTQARTRRASLIATVLIVSIGTISAGQMLVSSGDTASVVQSYDAIQTIGELSEALLSAEAGHRGFLLTDEPSYLEDYSAGVSAIVPLTQQLHQRLAPYVEARHLKDLEGALREKVAVMDEVISLHTQGARAEAVTAMQARTGKFIMDDLRGMLDIVRQAEEARLAERQADLRRTRNLGLLAVVSTTGFALLLSFFMIRGERAASKRIVAAVDIIQQQKGYVEAMLSSVSAPLILLDRDNIIRFANAAALSLLDDSAERLVGRPLRDYVQFRGASERPGDSGIFERAISERRVLRERRVGIQTPGGPQVIGLTVRPVETNGTPIGCMITLRDIEEEEATVEDLHQQDRLRSLEATLGRVLTKTGNATALLQRCGEAIRQTIDAEELRIWLGEANCPKASLVPLPLTGEAAVSQGAVSSVVQAAWRLGAPREDLVAVPHRFAFPLCPGPTALGVIEVRTRTPLHPRLAEELPRLAREIARGYERQLSAEKTARVAQEQDRFIATISHELRGPLVPLSYAVSEIAGGGDTSADSKLLGLLTRQVAHLERLVEDLLDVQRLQRGTLSLRLAPVDVHSVIEQGIEATLPLLESKKQKLELEISSDPLPVVADRARLVQVVVNLLNNASRYSPGETTIVVGARVAADEVEITVADHGIGISAENLERVFHMFEQGATGGNSEGLGIGLALVSQLVELHGGRVLAASLGVGAGATFTITLPLAAGTAPAKRVTPTKSVAHSGAMFERCVVVDDDIDSAETLALMLHGWGVQADVAHDALGALEAVHRLEPDLVLLDLTLPGQDRYRLIEQLRDKVGADVRIVAVTGHADDNVRREALERGFDDLLVKPISREQLAAAARRQLVSA